MRIILLSAFSPKEWKEGCFPYTALGRELWRSVVSASGVVLGGRGLHDIIACQLVWSTCRKASFIQWAAGGDQWVRNGFEWTSFCLGWLAEWALCSLLSSVPVFMSTALSQTADCQELENGPCKQCHPPSWCNPCLLILSPEQNPSEATSVGGPRRGDPL
jgi:hypothetical protein